MHELSIQSRVDVSHLSAHLDGDEYTIGDINQDIFIRIPAEGMEIIRLLDGKKTIVQIQEELRNSELDLDVIDFVETLLELNLVYSIDDQILRKSQTYKKSNRLAQKLGSIFFHPFINVFYTAIAILTIILLLFQWELIPKYTDVFIFNSVGATMLLFLVTSWLLTLIHEIGHYLAVARLGIPVTFRLSIRWYWIVIEANMNGLWSFSKEKRYVPFLAGMAWDVLLLLICLLLQFFIKEQFFVFEYIRMIALILFFRFIWQFLIFFRTDLYYVLITMTGIANLSGGAKLYLSQTVGRNTEEWNVLTTNEKRHARLFAYLYLAGILAATWLFTFYSIPAAYKALSLSLAEIGTSSILSLTFFDGLLVFLIILLEIVLWTLGAINRYKDKKKNQNQAEV